MLCLSPPLNWYFLVGKSQIIVGSDIVDYPPKAFHCYVLHYMGFIQNFDQQRLSQPTLLRASEARLTGASSIGGKCAESPPTFIERKTLEKTKGNRS